MAQLTPARISPELILLLKEITNILRQKGRKPTKENVCKMLVYNVRHNSTILEKIKNAV